jgi:hypothetical protein
VVVQRGDEPLDFTLVDVGNSALAHPDSPRSACAPMLEIRCPTQSPKCPDGRRCLSPGNLSPCPGDLSVWESSETLRQIPLKRLTLHS